MCVLGLCALIDLEQIPQVLNQVSGQILPAFILLFNGLKRAYACHAEHENDSDDDDEAEEDEETGKETETVLLNFSVSCPLHVRQSLEHGDSQPLPVIPHSPLPPQIKLVLGLWSFFLALLWIRLAIFLIGAEVNFFYG